MDFKHLQLFQGWTRTKQVEHLERDHGLTLEAATKGKYTTRTPAFLRAYQVHVSAHDNKEAQ